MMAYIAKQLEEVNVQIRKYNFDGKSIKELRALKKTGIFATKGKEYGEIKTLLTRKQDLELTLAVLKRKLRYEEKEFVPEAHFEDFVPEAEISKGAQQDGLISAYAENQTLIDVEGKELESVMIGDTSSSLPMMDDPAGIADFLSRPISIYSGVASSGVIEATLDVWDLFTLEPSVRAKLRNYAFLKGNLHVRVSLSATSWHYGRLLASYQPIPTANDALQGLLTSYGFTTSFRPLLVAYLSQAKGSSVMDVTQNIPLEIVCPYISPKNIHRLYNPVSTAIAAGTSFVDFEVSGTLFLWTIKPITAINPSASEVSIEVYAWMEDVELGMSTGTQLAITTEADEQETGPIESVALRSEKILGAMERIPIIGKYATASKMAVGALGRVASLFGWSRPVMPPLENQIRPVAYSNSAQVIGWDTCHKVTLDPKQEVTVDPSAVASSEDEMTISYIAEKLGYITTFDWGAASDTLEDFIYRFYVNPLLSTYYLTVDRVYIQPSPMAYAVRPFAFWRGDIQFRLEIMCSAYHRGKLAIVYEPNPFQEALITAETFLNKQYVRVIDIQQTQTVDFCIGWASPWSWLEVGDQAEPVALTDQVGVSGDQRRHNGMIYIVPFTKLQSPDGSSVKINLYACCPNLKVNGLLEEFLPIQRNFVSESDDVDTPVAVTCLEVNGSKATTSGIAQRHFGEIPTSFRALLKRFVSTARATLGSDTAALPKYFKVVDAIYPDVTPYYGGPDTTFPSLYSYLRFAYLAMRGSYKLRLRLDRSVVPYLGGVDQVSLYPPYTSSVSSATVVAGSPNMRLEGTVQYIKSITGAIQAEFPYYSNNLFQFSSSRLGEINTSDEYMSDFWYRNYEYDATIAISTAIPGELIIDSASGEDFQMMYFLGAPFYSYDVV